MRHHLLILSFFLSSCTLKMYVPEMVNAPGFVEKGEAKLTGAVAMPVKNVAVAADIAYAPLDHIAVTGSYRMFTNKDAGSYISDPEDYRGYGSLESLGGVYNGNRWEAGAGYYGKLSQYANIEIYGGLGSGVISRKDGGTPLLDFSSKYNMVYIQPGMSLHLRERLSFAWGAKVALHRYYSFASPDPNWKYYVTNSRYDTTMHDVTARYYGFITPYANMEIGHKFVRLDLQVGINVPYTSRSRLMGGMLTPYCTLGLAFHYAHRHYKRNTPKLM